MMVGSPPAGDRAHVIDNSAFCLQRVREFMAQAERETLPQRALQAVRSAEQWMKLADRARRRETRVVPKAEPAAAR